MGRSRNVVSAADEVDVEDDDMTRQSRMPKDEGREVRVQIKVERMTYA
jgi:hypothetical protein